MLLNNKKKKYKTKRHTPDGVTREEKNEEKWYLWPPTR
jgi:hypothetical protein